MNKLLSERKNRGLTQMDVEVATGIDTATQSLYENGLRLPTVKNAKILGEFYRFNWMELFEDDKIGVGTETQQTAC